MKILSYRTVEIVLSEMELDSFFERFGSKYWNDQDNIIFIPVNDFIGDNIHLRDKFYNFFPIDRDVSGIYINCDKSSAP